jgi:hypothetical protein
MNRVVDVARLGAKLGTATAPALNAVAIQQGF